MKLSLPAELEAFVQQKMESGNYVAPTEVVVEALWLLKQQDEFRQMRLEELKREIAKGIDAADRGDVVSGEEVFRKLRDRLAERIEQPK
jgi:antitoxin ParD1/3/4